MLKWNIGDVTVTRVVEYSAPLPLAGLLPDAPAGGIDPHLDWLQPHFVDDDGNIVLSIHALLVESQGRKIVVDTCLGTRVYPDMEAMSNLETTFLEDIASAHFAREDVDVVVCTHLHFDHVGWNTMRDGDRWVPTFPNARYLFGRTEWEHWSKTEGHFTLTFGDTVRPIVEGGLADLVNTDHEITDEVRLEPTPGHTPGHVSVRISSGGQNAVITGDLVHHPVQLAEPDWVMSADSDPTQASATRKAFVERYGDQDVLVIGTHFAGPTAGRIVRTEKSCRFEA